MKTTKRVSNIDTQPNAWIVNSQDRGRKSVKSGNKIYLQDDQEFQIELYNPLTESVLSDIRVNGKSVSKSGLVLRPGERFYLDCFIDDKKKFIFKTYEVDDSVESEKSISNNGSVEIFFYKEDTINLLDWTKRYDSIIEKHYYPQWYPWYTPRPYYPWGGTIIYGTGTTTIGTAYNTLSNNITTSNANYTLGSTTYTSNVGLCSSDILYNSESGTIETGRVEKGQESNQKFDEIDMEFQKNHISSIMYQLLPESKRPIEKKDLYVDIKKIIVKEGTTINAKDILRRESDEVIELIRKLSDLHKAGILTDDEFFEKKIELLSKI
jgi:hypothetical protein